MDRRGSRDRRNANATGAKLDGAASGGVASNPKAVVTEATDEVITESGDLVVTE